MSGDVLRARAAQPQVTGCVSLPVRLSLKCLQPAEVLLYISMEQCFLTQKTFTKKKTSHPVYDAEIRTCRFLCFSTDFSGGSFSQKQECETWQVAIVPR